MLQALAVRCFEQGVGLLQGGSAGTAAVLLGMAARLAPSNLDYQVGAAQAALALGDRDGAAAYCERALEIDPSHAATHDLLLGTFLHGENYLDVLIRIHRYLNPRTYIEIGVETGRSIRQVGADTRAIGVDPSPAIDGSLPSNVRIVAQTSDEFFARSDLGELLAGAPVELAFIDGMHQFEFALRDFTNLERLSAPGGTILIHDCFPHSRITAERERHYVFWSGDIWRLIVLLMEHRPDLQIHTIAAPPTGLALVRNLDPGSRFIPDNLERLCAKFLALEYSFLRKGRAEKLSLIPNDWNRVRALLDAPAGKISAGAPPA